MFARHDPTIDRMPRLPADPTMARELRELLSGPSGMATGATRFLLQGWSSHSGTPHAAAMLEIGTEALNHVETIARALGDLGRGEMAGPDRLPSIISLSMHRQDAAAGRDGTVSARPPSPSGSGSSVPGSTGSAWVGSAWAGSFDGSLCGTSATDPADDIHDNLAMERDWRVRIERAVSRCANDDLRRLLEGVAARARVHEARWSAMLAEIERAEDDTPCPGGMPREEDLIFDGRHTMIMDLDVRPSLTLSAVEERHGPPPRRPVLHLVPS